jgi:hypothetical protein
MITGLAKSKRVRLKGEPLKKLNYEIHERDNYTCVVCGGHVPLEEKFHHEPCGANKSDEISKGCLLCQECHYQRHHGKAAGVIKETCEVYLNDIYHSC